MKTANLTKMVAILTVSGLLFACGGGGGGAAPQGIVVNGVARAGVFTKGKVVFDGYSGALKNKEYAITFTNFSSPLGSFQCNIGAYSGPLRINVSGSYLDEATGKTVSVTPENPMKAAIAQSAVTNGVTVPVTPLTDIAATKAITAGISNESITQNNQGVAQLFGLKDVTTTIPALPTVANLSSPASSENTYAVALIKLSDYVAQYAAASSGTTTTTVTSDVLQAALPAALAQFGNGITIVAGTGSATTPTVTISAPDLKNTLTTIMSAPVIIDNTPVTLPAATLSNMNSSVTSAGSALMVQKYNLYVTGSATGSVYGLQVMIPIPPGVTIAADANGVVSLGAATSALAGGIINATLKPAATSGGQILQLTYVAGTRTLTNDIQLATIICSVADPATVLLPGTATAYDKNGAKVTGINVTAALPAT